MHVRQVETNSATYTVYADGADPRKPYSVYLHGGPGFNSFGERQVLGSRLRSATNVLWFDQVGCAESPAKDPSNITLDSLIDDVAAIARAFTDAPVHVLAHCAGVPLTHDLVRRHRSLVRSVVWLAPLAVAADAFKGLFRRSVEERKLDLGRLSAGERSAFERFVRTPAEEFGQGEATFMLELAGKVDDFWGLYWSDRAAMARHLEWLAERPFAPEAFVRIAAENFARSSIPWPSYEGIPALLLYDDGDPVLPWRQHAAKLAAHVPHARTQVVSGGYHWLQFQTPDACAACMLEFLGSVA